MHFNEQLNSPLLRISAGLSDLPASRPTREGEWYPVAFAVVAFGDKCSVFAAMFVGTALAC